MTEIDKNVKTSYKEQLTEAYNDLKTPGRRYRQIPNLLTASRLLSPLLIIPAALMGNTAFAMWATAGFGFTDLIDGALARVMNVKSELGADLDAFSDKMFAGTLLIGGAIFNPILITNILLEMAIAGINIKQKLSGKEASSTPMGKKKTWVVFGLGALGLVAPALNLAPAIIPALAVGTAALQGLTIASYISKYNKKEEPVIDEIKEEPEVEIVPEPTIGENYMPILNKNKIKEYLEGTPTILLTEEEKKQQSLDEMKKLTSFFEEPQQQEIPKVYKKTNNNNL